MKTIYFIRHAESEANAGGLTKPNDQIRLSPKGREQAAELAQRLQIVSTGVLVSRFPRTQDTARPFCERLGLSPVVHPLTHEFETIDPQLIAGMNLEQRRPITEAYWQAADPLRRVGPAAETFGEFLARVDAFRTEMEALPDATVVFGHGMWMALLVWRLLGFSASGSEAMRDFRRFQLGLPMKNCASYAFTAHQAGHWRIQSQIVSAGTD